MSWPTRRLNNSTKYLLHALMSTAVSHSSTESEIISLESGLRLDGLPALELWDLIVSVFGSMTQTSDRAGRPVDTERSQKSQGKINVLNNIDCVPSNVQSSCQEALLYVFEDNEAVIKMIIKGRSPTMRHVSRTHRVALHWLLIGIICCACSILAISVLQFALIQWRNDLNKIQEENESQQNRDR